MGLLPIQTLLLLLVAADLGNGGASAIAVPSPDLFVRRESHRRLEDGSRDRHCSESGEHHTAARGLIGLSAHYGLRTKS